MEETKHLYNAHIIYGHKKHNNHESCRDTAKKCSEITSENIRNILALLGNYLPLLTNNLYWKQRPWMKPSPGCGYTWSGK